MGEAPEELIKQLFGGLLYGVVLHSESVDSDVFEGEEVGVVDCAVEGSRGVNAVVHVGDILRGKGADCDFASDRYVGF